MAFNFHNQPIQTIYEPTPDRTRDLTEFAVLVNTQLDSILQTSHLPYTVSGEKKPITISIQFTHFLGPDESKVVTPPSKLKSPQTITITIEIDRANRFRHLRTSETSKLLEDTLAFGLSNLTVRQKLTAATTAGDEQTIAKIIYTLLDKSFATKQLRKSDQCRTKDDLGVYLSNSIFKTLDAPQLKTFLTYLIKNILAQTAVAARQTEISDDGLAQILSSQFDHLVALEFNRTFDPEIKTSVGRYLVDKTADVAARGAMFEALKQQIINDLVS
ncbi:TPA: hypothetical protein DF272_03995 [Candidatus Falkowbacteria bacterium]|nr:hypothetical protein [Candidatus Falkowbacteria bacterium]